MTASSDHALNNQATGRPTWLFWLIASASILQGLHFLVGTAATPGVVEAWEAGDTLALVAQFCAVCTFNGWVVNLWWGRVNVRSDEEGVLHKIGVGQCRVSAARWKTVENMIKASSWKAFVLPIWFGMGSVAVVVVVTGRGAQSSALYNQISAVVLVVLMLVLNHQDGVRATSTSVLAAAVVGQQVENLTRAVSVQPTDDAETWEREVVRPAQQLVVSLRLISAAWGHVVAFAMPQVGVILPFFVCNAWSTTVRRNLAAYADEMGWPWLPDTVSWFFTIVAVVLIPTMLYIMASGPAGISTACDELSAALNQARLDNLTKENNERVALLERALDRESNGSGIGFSVNLPTHSCLLSSIAPR